MQKRFLMTIIFVVILSGCSSKENNVEECIINESCENEFQLMGDTSFEIYLTDETGFDFSDFAAVVEKDNTLVKLKYASSVTGSPDIEQYEIYDKLYQDLVESTGTYFSELQIEITISIIFSDKTEFKFQEKQNLKRIHIYTTNSVIEVINDYQEFIDDILNVPEKDMFTTILFYEQIEDIEKDDSIGYVTLYWNSENVKFLVTENEEFGFGDDVSFLSFLETTFPGFPIYVSVNESK